MCSAAVMSLSLATAPSGDDAVYDEVHETAMKKFAMAENVCYEVTKPLSKDSTGVNEAKGPYSKKIFLVLFVLVIALLLGTVCACISFALEISNLKSQMASLQTASSQHVQSHALEQLNTTMHVLSDDFLFIIILKVSPVLLSLPPPLQDTTGSTNKHSGYTVISTGSVGVVGPGHGLV